VAFPDIIYDMNWTSDTVNAQAFVLADRCWVRLYGGLARHKRIGVAGLAFALAHETGHHLGGPPHHPIYFWLSSEERASTWALEVGLAHVFDSESARLVGATGLVQLSAVKSATIEVDSPYGCTQDD
jgi:hypothetical protein